MTTAARPTFHPAVGGEDQGYFRMEAGTRQLSVKDMPGHTRLKMRKAQVLGNNGTNAEQNRKISSLRLGQIACEPRRQISRSMHLFFGKIC